MPKKKDVAEFGEQIYEAIFSIDSFKKLHERLLEGVMSHIEASQDKRLLVIGTGPSGSPYNTIPDKFKNAFKSTDSNNYKAVFLDSSLDVMTSCLNRYEKLGIIGGNGLEAQIIAEDADIGYLTKKLEDISTTVDIIPKSEFTEEQLEQKLTFFQHDLRDPIPKKLGKFDAIESSFCLHHAAQYVKTLGERIKDITDLLRQGGIFHWGTGFADMSYSEKKIMAIGKEASRTKAYPIVLVDKRQKEYPYILRFSEGELKSIRKYERELPFQKQIVIESNGLVKVPQELAEECNFINHGYAMAGEHYIFPLINPQNSKDYEGLISHVQAFYRPTGKEIARLKTGEEWNDKLDNNLKDAAIKADIDEEENAKKGLVEYYMPKGIVLNLLKQAKFDKIEVEHPNKDNGFKDLVNIFCYK